ncbi:MAG: hypothetical protein IPK17_09440 [Chloroflexi bacterium]|uniref:hypothetical protein n=1 Tax=Candidatus Flexifilum breve TaxID=3140694 RepID=UPI003136ECF2|nr:hypothetical protein [Chloroflexota bacterium]
MARKQGLLFAACSANFRPLQSQFPRLTASSASVMNRSISPSVNAVALNATATGEHAANSAAYATVRLRYSRWVSAYTPRPARSPESGGNRAVIRRRAIVEIRIVFSTRPEQRRRQRAGVDRQRRLARAEPCSSQSPFSAAWRATC